MIYFFIFLDITHGAFQKWDKMSFYPYYYSVELIFSELLCNWRVNIGIDVGSAGGGLMVYLI